MLGRVRSFSRVCGSVNTLGLGQRTRLFSTESPSGGVMDLYIWGAKLKAEPFAADISTPRLLPAVDESGWKQMSLGLHHGAFLTGNGDVYTFGTGSYGELGRGDSRTNKTPQNLAKVVDLPPIAQVECGEYHTIALSRDGEVFTWGWEGKVGTMSALGHPKPRTLCPLPRLVEALKHTKIAMISAGKSHCHALTVDGLAYAWGLGENCMLGSGMDSSSHLLPFIMRPLENERIVKIASGGAHSAALNDRGQLWTWGRDDGGQLGVGSGVAMDVYKSQHPTVIEMEKKIIDFSCGTKHTDIITESHNLWLTGRSVYHTPHEIMGHEGLFLNVHVTAVAGGYNFTAIVDNEGYLYTMGCCNSMMCQECVGHSRKKGRSGASPQIHDSFGPDGMHAVQVFTGEKQIGVLVAKQ
eukprot:gb/GEZN01006626.1/.p1 GENE.gb/GEZN01006626.1/~~gb/GEZN01006626.1/.p1  ORF type:complete len:420 (-),score=11.46 gb/GEZN01006626.1/:379-1608(-)